VAWREGSMMTDRIEPVTELDDDERRRFAHQKVSVEMAEWAHRPLNRVYPVNLPIRRFAPRSGTS
jgi:hypothetical protein